MADGNTIRSVAKAMELLQLLSDVGEPMTLTDISSRAGLPKSTAFGLLTTMRDHDVITQHADGKYALGLRLFEYGCRASAFWNVSSLARPYLAHLVDETGGSAMLSTYENGHIVALDQAEGRDSLRVVSAPGARLPLHCTSQGKIVLAHMSESEAAKLLSRAAPLTPFTPTRKQTQLRCSRPCPPAGRQALPWKTANIKLVCAPFPRRSSPAAARSNMSSACSACSAPCTRMNSRTPSAPLAPRGRCAQPRWGIRGDGSLFGTRTSPISSKNVPAFFETRGHFSSFSAQWPSPASILNPWLSAPSTALRFSRAAFSDPGRFTMRLFPLLPAAARESIARGVICKL